MEMTNAQLHEVMQEYPDKIAEAETAWKQARLYREKIEALAYFRLKAEMADQKVTESWLQNKVLADEEVHKAKLDEIVKESEYNRLYENLMCAKKMASLRTAF